MRAHGLDISKYNITYTPIVNPPLPVDFVIQRLTYRLTKDEKLNELTPNVLKAPIKGAYHYLNSDTAWKPQADLFISLMNGKYDFWAWDIEKNRNTNIPDFINGVVPALKYLYQTTKKPGLLYTDRGTWMDWLVPIHNELIQLLTSDDIPIRLWIAHWWNVPNSEGTPNYFLLGAGNNMPRNWAFWQYAADTLSPFGHEYGVGSENIDVNVFNGTKEELYQWTKSLGGNNMSVLPVSYVSQIMAGGLEHSSDCGAASSLMLLNTYNLAKTITVDAFYNSIYPSGDIALSASDMQIKMASYGLKNTWQVDTTMEQVFYFLRNRRPLLALIHYAPLVDAGVTEKTGFRGAHFVIINGIDLDNVCIQDPYRDDGKQNIAVPIKVFEQAWVQCNLDGNPDGGCIIPNLPIQNLGTVVPPVANDEYYMNVNGLNVRVKADSSSLLVKTIWKVSTTNPIIHALASTLTNGYVQLSDFSGWVWFTYLIKK